MCYWNNKIDWLHFSLQQSKKFSFGETVCVPGVSCGKHVQKNVPAWSRLLKKKVNNDDGGGSSGDHHNQQISIAPYGRNFTAAGRIRVHNGRLLVFLRMTNSVGCWRVNLEHDADGLPVVPQCWSTLFLITSGTVWPTGLFVYGQSS